MYRVTIRLVVVSAVIAAITLGGVAGPVAAAEVSEEEHATEIDTDLPELRSPVVDFDRPSEDDASNAKDAFLTSKKAYHEARQDIQAIKKGDESPRKGVPSFFDSEDSNDDEEDTEDEPSIKSER